MECGCSVRHAHPLCRERRFRHFLWWHEKHGHSVPLTAVTLGVSRRTVHRWLAQRDVPLHVAVLLDQMRFGPVFRYAYWRGNGAARYEWRELVTRGLHGRAFH